VANIDKSTPHNLEDAQEIKMLVNNVKMPPNELPSKKARKSTTSTGGEDMNAKLGLNPSDSPNDKKRSSRDVRRKTVMIQRDKPLCSVDSSNPWKQS
jgi:hypothetical protein